MELLKDYDIGVLYQTDKDNVVSVSYVEESMNDLLNDVQRLNQLGVRLKILKKVVLWFIITPSHLKWLR